MSATTNLSRRVWPAQAERNATPQRQLGWELSLSGESLDRYGARGILVTDKKWFH
jgi:hypothetical protein